MSSRFQRWILPGLAFKAAVIGGGYATGRELAEYFIPSGPQGGVAAILVAMLAWSALCALTFAFAHATRSFDYHRFFATRIAATPPCGPLGMKYSASSRPVA